MGGRGATSGGGGGGGMATSVQTQYGTADLSGFPLQYLGRSQLTDAQRKPIEAFERKQLNASNEGVLLVDGNGNVILEKGGGKSSVSIPNSAFMQAEAFTHNHPRTSDGILGGTFSKNDRLSFTSSSKLKTMRASAAEGTYTITKGNNFYGAGFISYMNGVERTAINNHKARQSDINKGIKTKYHYDYKAFNKDMNDSFNQMLVDIHNGYIAGQKQYGYTYSLEKRK